MLSKNTIYKSRPPVEQIRTDAFKAVADFIKDITEKEVKKTDADDDEDMDSSEAIWNAIAYISQKERDAVHNDDFAGPHRSFPIRNSMDVEHAAKLVGHGANPSAIKRKIIQIARRKGLSLPDSWKLPDEKSH